MTKEKKTDLRAGINYLSDISIINLNDMNGEWVPVYCPQNINPNVVYFESETHTQIQLSPWFIYEGTYAYQDITLPVSITENSLTGLLNILAPYEIIINISSVYGGLFNCEIYGSRAQTYGELIIELNKCITGAKFSIVNGKLRLTHEYRGLNTLSMTDTNLISSLTGVLELAVDGYNYTNYNGDKLLLDLPFSPDMTCVLKDNPIFCVRTNDLAPGILKIVWFE